MWASQAILECLNAQCDVQPDLIVAHSGFFSAICLRELYHCPIINYFEYFYQTTAGDMDFRSDLPSPSLYDRVRARARNAALLLDLENCDAGYSPTRWQRRQLPDVFQPKISTVFDGIETDLWHPQINTRSNCRLLNIPPNAKVITYVSRGLESIRGFDIFMKVAKRLCDLRSDVIALVIGEDRIAYGGDQRFTAGKTFKQWVLDQDDYDLNRIRFLGRVPLETLAQILSLSDLHIYLAAPFVLSWSLFNALACGAIVLASDTAPVQEIIQHGQNGLLCDFFDIDSFVEYGRDVLDRPQSFYSLRGNGVETIRQHYSINACLPQMVELYQRVLTHSRASTVGIDLTTEWGTKYLYRERELGNIE